LNSILNAEVLEADIRDLKKLLPTNSFDLLFSNPPYRKAGTGKLNPSHQKAIARHEIRMTLEDLVSCAALFLKPKGRLSIVLPGFREADLTKLLDYSGFNYLRRRYVQSFAGEAPTFLLATMSRSSGILTELPPLVIYDSPGNYTTELQRMLEEDLGKRR
jgi:tRNA1Val (adenine37-N6)-methyltransferase